MSDNRTLSREELEDRVGFELDNHEWNLVRLAYNLGREHAEASTAEDVESKPWWDGEWDTLEQSVRDAARDEYYRVVREQNLKAFDDLLSRNDSALLIADPERPQAPEPKPVFVKPARGIQRCLRDRAIEEHERLRKRKKLSTREAGLMRDLGRYLDGKVVLGIEDVLRSLTWEHDCSANNCVVAVRNEFVYCPDCRVERSQARVAS